MMASKGKKTSSHNGNLVDVIPLFDPNSLILFSSFFESSISDSDLLHLVDMGVLPPKELSRSRTWERIFVPTKDTHESVAFTTFFVHILGSPICPFFWSLLDFYSIDPTHLNPNSVLQISIFVHLYEAFLGIAPLWFVEIYVSL
jgi:hypothetical protein